PRTGPVPISPATSTFSFGYRKPFEPRISPFCSSLFPPTAIRPRPPVVLPLMTVAIDTRSLDLPTGRPAQCLSCSLECDSVVFPGFSEANLTPKLRPYLRVDIQARSFLRPQQIDEGPPVVRAGVQICVFCPRRLYDVFASGGAPELLICCNVMLVPPLAPESGTSVIGS